VVSFRLAGLALCCVVAGCGRPHVGNNGTFYFEEPGTHGAAVVTPSGGVEFHDRADVPSRVVSHDPNEPWRAPIGFILPKDGKFTQTSKPHVLSTEGLAIILRPSDTRVPSWGGEVLVRVDIIAPAAEGTARWGENVAILVDGQGSDTEILADTALGQLAGRDRVSIFLARGAKTVVPSMPASHRSMELAALTSHMKSAAPRNFVGALAAADRALNGAAEVKQRLVILSDHALSTDENALVAKLAQRGVQVATIATVGNPDDQPERVESVREAVPAAGATTFRSVRLTFQGTPAPSHVLEASGGEARWVLDGGDVVLGNVRAGEARTEMLRVSVPAWVPNEQFRFTVTAHVDDLAWGGPRDFSADVPCVYDDDIERIAKSRHGDVIAYASAMATLRRLDKAFIGDAVEKSGGLRKVAELHAQSMQNLAKDSHDFATQEQADMLAALLSATR